MEHGGGENWGGAEAGRVEVRLEEGGLQLRAGPGSPLGTKAKFAFPLSQGNWHSGHRDGKQRFPQGTYRHTNLGNGERNEAKDFSESSEDRLHSLPVLSIVVFYHLYRVNGTLSCFKCLGSH